MTNNENRDICSKCGGKCCKKSGCDYYPEDIKSSAYKDILKILEEGNISVVSCFQTQKIKDKIVINPVLYLRARNTNRDIIDLLSFKTKCMMLTEKGCAYDYENRPTGGKMLVPNENGKCHRDNEELKDFIEKWKPYQKSLEKIVKIKTGLTVEEKIKEDFKKVLYDIYYNNLDDVSIIEKYDMAKTVQILMNVYKEEFDEVSNNFRRQLTK